MNFSPLDTTAFVGYFVVVGIVAVVVSRREKVAADYFLAGRNLPWWLIGISLIASNISTEQLVGQAGQGMDFGLAVAAYEWMAAITLVIVARWFLPAYLANRVTTMPEYLERRFDVRSRGWLAVYMILAYTFVAMATVLYSGGLALETMFGLPLWWGVTILAVFAGAYTAYGGLKAVVWSDLIQGTMLLLGGALTAWLGLKAVGGWGTLMEEAGDKFHMVLPLDHPELPWFAIFFGGLWIANLFYWGCNQFITQRTLGARNIKQGRYGIVFAAYLKLLIPFIAVIPGIMAYVLYADEITRSDMAYPVRRHHVVPGFHAELHGDDLHHGSLPPAPEAGVHAETPHLRGPDQHGCVPSPGRRLGALPGPLRPDLLVYPGVLGAHHAGRGRGVPQRPVLEEGDGSRRRLGHGPHAAHDTGREMAHP